jgi:putative transport protein
MNAFLDILAHNPLVLLFTIIGLGYLLGNISIFGFKLGVAAVLFVGIAFSAIDNRLILPEYIYIIGLVLFVYSIALQSGPGFFSSFRRGGLRFSLVTALLLGFGAVVAVVVGILTDLSAPNIAGVFCGALTNTPALAAVVETAQGLSANLPPDIQHTYATGPVVAYGLTYPFGVFGVILLLYLAQRRYKIDFAQESANAARESAADDILSRTYRVTNPALAGRTVEGVLELAGHTGFTLSRIRKGDQIDIVLPDTLLESGDLLVAVGNAEAQERARLLFGEEAAEVIKDNLDGIIYRRFYVSNKSLVGKSIREAQLHRQVQATITRLRRGDVEFIPSAETPLELGDRVRVVFHRNDVDRVTRLFGNSVKSISETDFLSLSLGIVLGVFLGMIPIPLPHGLTLKLGFAGGPLIAGLILGRLQRTGPINWEMPFSANLALRQIGLVFFLSAIGTLAGSGLIETLVSGGWQLLLAGAAVTTAVTLATIYVGYRYFRLPMMAVMGMMSGIQTQPAILAYATQQTDSDQPNLWYATVYPASMVTKIILAQIIVSAIVLS